MAFKQQTIEGIERRHSELERLWPAPGARRRPAAAELRRHVVGAIYTPEGREFDFTNTDELWLPLNPSGVSLAAAATQDYELKPNRVCVPGPLILSGANDDLIMTQLAIGGKNMLLGAGFIPCSMFNNGAFHKIFRGGTASTSSPITFTLKNVHASVAKVVYGGWICTVESS